jgi:alpha-L-fucosidase
LQADTARRGWQRLIGRAGRISDDAFAYVLARYRLDDLRGVLVRVNQRPKQNQQFQRAKIHGLLVVAGDANEQFHSRCRCGPQCSQRIVTVSDRAGQEREVTEYCHRQVYAHLDGPDFSTGLEVEPVRPGEEEAQAALRLRGRIRRGCQRDFPELPADHGPPSGLAQTPSLKAHSATPHHPTSSMNRRNFLKTTGTLLAASALPPSLPAAPAEKRPGPAPAAPKLAPRFGDGRDWWFARRYGLFMHWGLYSIHGWHEQEQWRRRVPRADYMHLARQWNPVKFDPEAWLDLAEEAGMTYLCLTTKHHDGFCLWDTKLTPFNTMNTPYGKDPLKLLADACHRRSFPLCLYYSIADWNQPNYPNEGRHHELPPQAGDAPDWGKYLEFLRGQVRELCTNYGEIHGFWWDMNVPKHVDPNINAMIRQLQPNAVINDRGFDPGDFGTPERDYTKDGEVLLSFDQRTEACQSVGMESWGYRHREDYYTDRHLQRSLAKYLARDANYLLNAGPRGDGTFPPESVAILVRLGRWHRVVGEAFQGTVPASHLTTNRSVLLTRKNDTLYVIFHSDPAGDALKLKPLAVPPRRATLLNTGQPVETALELVPSEHATQEPCLRLRHLPVNDLANTVLVVKLEFDRLSDATGRAAAPGAENSILVR